MLKKEGKFGGEDVNLGKIIREHLVGRRYFMVKIQMKRNNKKWSAKHKIC